MLNYPESGLEIALDELNQGQVSEYTGLAVTLDTG